MVKKKKGRSPGLANRNNRKYRETGERTHHREKNKVVKKAHSGFRGGRPISTDKDKPGEGQHLQGEAVDQACSTYTKKSPLLL